MRRNASIQSLCVDCGTNKQAPMSNGKFKARCNACINAKYHTGQYSRDTQLKKKYGIVQADYDRMFAEQGGVCKICHQPQHHSRFTALCIDHCHTTGEVRGLLCSDCNTAIGLLGDSVERLNSAIKYLSGA